MLYKTLPQVQILSRTIAESLYMEVSEKYESFFLKSPEERYLELINKRPNFLQRVPQYMIASYLGMTPEGLSRIRKRNS